MPELHATIVRPVVTEKSSAAYGARKEYAFRVHSEATKPNDQVMQLRHRGGLASFVSCFAAPSSDRKSTRLNSSH